MQSRPFHRSTLPWLAATVWILAVALFSGSGCSQRDSAGPVDAGDANTEDGTGADLDVADSGPDRDRSEQGDDDGGGADGDDGGDAEDAEDGGDDGGGGTACNPYVPRQRPVDLFVFPQGAEEKLLGLIGEADESLDMLMYQFTLDSFIDALILAKERGVEVRVLLDPDQYVNQDTKQRLGQAGIDVRLSPTQFKHSHSKVLIIDGKLAAILSANLNDYLEYERNYGVVIEDTEDLADLQAVFDADWNRTSLDLADCTRLLVSPLNSRRWLTDFIEGADSSLDLAVMYLADKTLKSKVKAAAANGINVRVLLANPAWITDNTQTATELTAAGISVKYFTRYDLHAKLILADGEAFVGSENMSWTSLNSNREVGVIVTDPAATTIAIEQFEDDWLSGSNP